MFTSCCIFATKHHSNSHNLLQHLNELHDENETKEAYLRLQLLMLLITIFNLLLWFAHMNSHCCML
jgi:hypothetical protein